MFPLHYNLETQIQGKALRKPVAETITTREIHFDRFFSHSPVCLAQDQQWLEKLIEMCLSHIMRMDFGGEKDDWRGDRRLGKSGTLPRTTALM